MVEKQTVYLVDDDSAVRHALGTVLKNEQFAVRAFASAEALLESISGVENAVFVVDQRMKGMSGLELQEYLKSHGIAAPIIFITGHGDVQMSVKAMKAGAIDFLEKPFSNEKLLDSIREAFRREQSEQQQRALKAATRKKFESLTPREQEVMGYIVQGVSNKDLAKKLGVSSRTIEVHRSRVMFKMQSGSLPELVRMAAICGIGEP